MRISCRLNPICEPAYDVAVSAFVLAKRRVKNLIKVFQLESVSSVAVSGVPSDLPATKTVSRPAGTDAWDAFFSGTVIRGEDSGAGDSGGTVRTIATLGTRRPRPSPAHEQHEQVRSSLLDLFASVAPAPPPPTPAKPVLEGLLPTLEEGRKAMVLLHALLPYAAHLIPLPTDDEGLEAGPEIENYCAAEVEKAREDLVKGLEMGDLELIVSPLSRFGAYSVILTFQMLFEEQPESSQMV